jgi:hypothetical protein
MNLTPPALALVVLIGAVWPCLYLLGIGKRWGMLVPFSLLLFASCLATPRDWADRVLPTVWLGIQTRRSEIFLFAGVAGVLMALAQFGRLSGKRLSISAVLLVLIGLYSAMLRLHHGGAADGFESMIFAVCTLLPLVVTAAMVMDEPGDFRKILRLIAGVNALWVAMCALQFVVNSSYLTQGNQYRFQGLLGNPQHAGTLMAFFGVPVLWLLLNDRGAVTKFLYTGILGANMVLLIWSGSRTGMGMAVIGFAGVMYTRLGKSILFMPFAAIIAYVGFKLVLSITGLDIGASRLTTLEDTRTGAWLKLWAAGMESPLFGMGMDELDRSENSWLYAFASYGIGLLGLTLLMTFVAGFEFLRAVRLRSWLTLEERRVLDLTLGVVAMYFAGAVLEGYMISRVSASMPFYMVFAGAMAMTTRHAALRKAQGWDGSADQDAYADAQDEQEYGSESGPAVAY